MNLTLALSCMIAVMLFCGRCKAAPTFGIISNGNYPRIADILRDKTLKSRGSYVVKDMEDLVGEDEDSLRFSKRQQLDDYGHMRFGKRSNEDDKYGYPRFGRNIK
ncbi:hypothetical protein PUN28_010796 [Cardiocondyla obscurior]